MRRSSFLVAVLSLIGGHAGCGEQPPAEIAGPTAPEGHVPSSDGVPIAYTVRGQGDPALVFIHGWCCDRSFWADQIAAFSGDHRVVALDLGGHGESGAERPNWPLSAFAGDVKAVVQALDLRRVVLIGHSMGGGVALEAARLLPQRVIGIIGVDTLHDADQQYDPDEYTGWLQGFERDFAGQCGRFVRSMFSDGADPATVEQTREKMCGAPAEMGLALLRQFPSYDHGAAMSAVKVPIRCINAGGFPTNLVANRKYAPDFSVILMQDVGHFPMLERPDEFNRHLAATIASFAER